MTQYQVLIIDDNPDDVELCQRLLAKHSGGSKTKFELLHAASGAASLAMMASNAPDCVLLDYSLPGNNGQAIMAQILRAHPQVPVVIITGQGSEQVAANLLKAGARDYLIKSELDSNNLAATIVNAVSTPAEINPNGTSAAAYTLLVVDDNPDDRELVERTLRRCQQRRYRLRCAESGAAALAQVNAELPDCVLLDYSLPGANGLEVLSALKQDHPQLPVLLYSGQGNESIAAQAIKQGAADYLVKDTITTDLLDKVVYQALETQRFNQKIAEKNQQLEQYQAHSAERQQRYERVMQATNMVVWEYTRADKHYFVDPKILSLLGEPAIDKINLQFILERVHKEDLAALTDYWQALINGQQQTDTTFRLRHTNGQWLWIRQTGNTVSFDAQGKPASFAGLYEDISEKNREEIVFNQLATLSYDMQLNLAEKIHLLLQLGIDFFGLEKAVVSKVIGENYKVLYSQPETAAAPGSQFPLSDTYCDKVFGTTQVLAWHHVGNTAQAKHGSYTLTGLETYIGAGLYCKGKAFGTLAFAAKTKRSKPFGSREKSLMRLMAQWLSTELTRNQQLEDIENSSNFLQLIQDSIPDMLFVKDEQFRIVRANPEFLKVYPEDMRDSVIGTTTLESYSHDEAEAFLQQDKIALREGQSEIEETIAFPDGKKRTLLTKKIRFHDQNHQPFMLGIARDITDLKQAESQRHELLEAMENTVEGVSRINPQGHYSYVNEAYATACGYTPAELIGQPWVITVDNAEHNAMRAAYQTMLETGKIAVETRGVRKDGSKFYKLVTMISRYGNDHEFIGHHCFMSDITQRKLAEEALIRSNNELQRFAYVASHDLQEPLRMVKSFTQLLKQQYAEQLDTQANEFIDYACDGATRMQALILDLLEYARVDSEGDAFTQVDMNVLKPAILANLTSAIEQSQANIQWPELPTVTGDAVRLSSVLQNLIGNALKYRKSDSAPLVSLTCTNQQDAWLFSVADNGIGMKPEYCQQIFEPFKRLHRKQDYPGTGMGLSICKKAIESMGGEIWAESQLGKGTKVCFTLPSAPNPN